VRTHRRFPQDKFVSPSEFDPVFLPSNLIRASVSKSGRSAYVTVTSTGEAVDDRVETAGPDSLQGRIDALPASAKWALQHLQITDNGSAIASAIKEGTAVAVSDGGLKFGLGTAAYIIEGNDEVGRIRGVNQVPGPIKPGDLHRCEVSGAYAVIMLIHEVYLMT
jgi:hypothetical protein